MTVTNYIQKLLNYKELIKILRLNNFPILFEGLHRTSPLLRTNFNNRIVIIRAHNIEHNYYRGLSKSEYPFVVASNNPNQKLESQIKNYDNISFIKLKSNDELTELLKSAHVNILPTFQVTGIKLKLINALFNGRFCLVNDKKYRT